MKNKVIFVGLAAACTVMAQAQVQKKIQVKTVQSGEGGATVWVQEAPGLEPAGPHGTFKFIAAEAGFSGSLVKGAPYTGDGVTEFTQTLADGTRIRRTSSTRLARDGEGRTRQEHNLGDSGGPSIVTIHDPVAEVTYTLNHREKTAHKLKPFRLKLGENAQPAAPGRALKGKGRTAAEDVVIEHKINAAPVLAGVTRQVMVFRSAEEGRTESLGTQVIEGVSCEGTRVTTTIPPGEIGNDRPITTTVERWFSPELKTVVLSRTDDPMSGETVYRLSNIRRGEPDKRLFEVPAGYTVTEDATVKLHRE